MFEDVTIVVEEQPDGWHATAMLGGEPWAMATGDTVAVAIGEMMVELFERCGSWVLIKQLRLPEPEIVGCPVVEVLSE